MAIKSIMDYLPQIEKLRKEGVVKGSETGFKCLDELYSIKQGTYTFVYSEPTHGKSEFSFEIALNQALLGKRSLICSPETGTIDEIIAELVHKVSGSRIYITDYNHLDDGKFMQTLEWLSHMFLVLDTDDKTYSIPELFQICEDWEKEHPNERIDIIIGEPYNELDHSEMSKYGGRQDLYIEDLATIIRRLCRRQKRHFILTIHPSGSATPITDKHGYSYYPKPLPRQAAGGQALYRKAMTWITLWRPPKNYKNTEKDPDVVLENEVHIHIDKAKPKGVSFKGMCKLYFDWKKNRYCERIGEIECFAFDHKKEFKVLGGKNITDAISNKETEGEELPF